MLDGSIYYILYVHILSFYTLYIRKVDTCCPLTCRSPSFFRSSSGYLIGLLMNDGVLPLWKYVAANLLNLYCEMSSSASGAVNRSVVSSGAL